MLSIMQRVPVICKGPQQNYYFDDGLSGNFDFILEPETVENILDSVEATCITEYKQEDSTRENINLTKNEISNDSFITSEKTLSFVCSEFSYVLGEESTNYPEESKGVPPNIECNKNVDDDNKEDNSNDSERDKDKTVQKSSAGSNKPGRKLGYRSDTTKDENAVCKVCGARAGRHSYYGGDVCHSCRAFFRRCIQRQSYPKFQCTKSCKVTINNRKKCKACRWRQCIDAGMKISYVQFDSPSTSRPYFSDSLNRTLQDLSCHSEKFQKMLCSFALNPGVRKLQIDNLIMNQSLQLISKVPTITLLNDLQRHMIMSESAHLLAVFRKMLFVTTSDKYFYHILYPPGWCIVPTMETKHHQLWTGTVQEILHLDSLGRILVDSYERNKDWSNKEDVGYRERVEIESFQSFWATKALSYCKKMFGEQKNYRSKFGSMIMLIHNLQSIHEINQLKNVMKMNI